ncbi:MAG: hypothetical protein L0241_29310 [Planctomycetia bacterium]|nr:hypothetical protein [Planctomycetia bacterium]
MTAELSRFAPEVIIAGLVCVAVVGVVVAIQWGRTRRREVELDLTRELVERGMSTDEIERLLSDHGSPTKGLLEQFNGLSRGSKFGIVFLVFMAMSLFAQFCMMALLHRR